MLGMLAIMTITKYSNALQRELARQQWLAQRSQGMKGRPQDHRNARSTDDELDSHWSASPTSIERLLLRPDEVATALGISRSKVYELLGSGELPSLRIGNSIRVSTLALRRWITRREMNAEDGPLGIEDGLTFLHG